MLVSFWGWLIVSETMDQLSKGAARFGVPNVAFPPAKVNTYF
jgi:hypothetical protein